MSQKTPTGREYLDRLSPFMTSQQVADYLGLTVQTIHRMRFYGTGPRYRKHGRYVRYHIDDVLEWSEGNARTSTSDKGAKR